MAHLDTDPGPRFERCVQESVALLRLAGDEWAKGDPEDPPSERVLESILKVFEGEKFLRRPYGYAS